MVLDNLAHDGDNGQGDQGGSQAQVGVTFSQIVESYWTPYHDVVRLMPVIMQPCFQTTI